MNRNNVTRIICSITLVFSSLMYLLSPSGVARAESNLVLNPGFETQGSSPADAANWAEGTNHSRASDKFHIGGWSLHSTFRGPGTDTRTTTPILVSPNTTYTYSGYIWRANSTGAACMDMADIAGERQLCASASGNWQFLSGEWNSGTNLSVTLRLITDGSPTGDIWFDDISLSTPDGPTATPTNTNTPATPTNTPTVTLTPTMTNTPQPGGNLVLNPGFETQGNSIGDAANWAEGTNHSRASDKFHTGSWSLHSSFRGAGTDTHSAAPIAVAQNTTYTYSGYVWRTNSTGGACMDMADIAGERQMCTGASGSWQFLSGTWNSGTNTGVTLRLITDGFPTGDIWFDDISLVSNSPICPTATPEPLMVGPVTSPTDQTSQIITVPIGNGDSVTVSHEFGSTTVTGNFSVSSPALVTVPLQANATHHLSVSAHVRSITNPDGCTYGNYTLSTTRDRLGAPLTIVQTGAAPSNLVLNPGFETQGNSMSDAANWIEGTNHARASDKFHTGGWSLRSTFRGGGTDTHTAAPIAVSANTTYVYSGYVWRTNSTGAACMDMADIAGERQMCTSASGSWQYLSGEWNSGSNANVSLRLITDGSPTGDIWFDDISLAGSGGPTPTPTVTPPPTDPPDSGNLILNSGFNTEGTGGAGDAANWTEGTNHDRSSDRFHTGGWSLHSTYRGAGTDTRTVAPIAVKPNTTYTYSGYIWRANSAGAACMDMADIPGERQVCADTSGGWQFVSGTWNSGSNTSVTLRLLTTGSPTGDVWFDDVALFGPNDSIGTPRVITPVFQSSDVVVASWVVTDPPFNADNTGVNDATSAIQSAIQAAEDAGGGVVWMPAGKYKITGSIHIYNHVTLRGDWRDPDSGGGSYGTVILANVPGGDENGPGLFRIWGSAGVKGLTVYYPNQSLPNPTPYPYTFEILGRYLGEDGYISGTVQNVTLLNSYRGISAGKDNTHEMHSLKNVKGSPLAMGIYLQDTADVGKVERIKFNGTYWANLDSSVSVSKPTLASINAWTRANGIGLQLGGVEWDQMTQISLSDYKTGVTFVQGRRIDTTAMFYDLTVLNSNVALNVDHLDNRIATVFSNCTLKANQGTNPIAIKVVDNSNTSVIFNNCTIGGGASKAVEVTGNTMVSFHNSTFDSWTGPYGITTAAGSLVSEGNTFSGLSSTTKGINLQSGTASAVVLQSNYPAGQSASLMFNNGTAISDPSADSGSYRRKDTGFNFAAHGQGAYPWRTIPRPPNSNLYNVRSAPYNAVADGVTDATSAIQNALNAAAAAGGGTVYLPAGIYMVSTHLTVGPGVELRGSEDVQHRTELNTQNGGPAMGTILYAVENKGNESGTPFISLNGDGAGVRGLSVLYPNQNMTLPLAAYPWTIRGNGSNVYAYDLSFVNAYKGVDFGTYRTDGHYVSQVVGLALKEGIRVGNASEGWMEDNLFNINAWARNYGLPNQLTELPCCSTTMWTVADAFTKQNLQAFIVGNGASNEHVLSNFVYGAWAGHTFEGSAQAVAINIAADGSLDEIRVTGTGPGGVKVINTEGCGGCNNGSGVALKVSGGTVGVWNMTTMMTYSPSVNISGGTTTLQGAAFDNGRATITAGTISMNGVFFSSTGVDATINGGTVNLWGNIATGGFDWSGTPASAGYNIPR